MPEPDPRDEIVVHLPDLRAFALSLTRNPVLAEDIVQETLIKAWSGFDAFQPGSRMGAWLFTILRNSFYSHHRRAGREVEDGDGVHAARLAVLPAHDGALMLGEVRAAFADLPEVQRRALMLVGVSGFSYAEAAAVCAVSEGTIKSRVSRARAALSSKLGYGADAGIDPTDRAIRAALQPHRDAA